MAITYFASASTPTDPGTNTGTPVAVVPPGSMVAGDLVVFYGYYRGSSTLSISNTGGQTWTTGVASANASNPTLSYFMSWCRFNGSWSANPSIAFTTSSTNTNAVMHVFRPTSGANTWAVDIASKVNDQPAAAANPNGIFKESEFVNNLLFTDANLLAYWKLENTSDSIGSNTLTNNGTTVFNAALFNNGADTATTNTTKFLNTSTDLGIGTGAVTIAGWVNFNSLPNGTTQILFQLTDSLGHYFQVYRNSGNSFSLDAAGNAQSISLNVNVGEWHHWAIVRDTGNTISKLYLNGVQATTAGIGTSTTTNTNKFCIAGDAAGSGNLANAKFDDVVFFNRVLTAGEVLSLSRSTLHDSTVAIASFMSDDDNTWGVPLPAGFTQVTSPSSQFRNTSGNDTSSAYVYQIFTVISGLPSPSLAQVTLGNDPYVATTIVFYEISPVVSIPNKIYQFNQSVKRSNFY